MCIETTTRQLLIVQGTSFYGYHATPKLFVQVFLYNPCVVASVVQILESGCIAERRFQTYESHIPFLLQVRLVHLCVKCALSSFSSHSFNTVRSLQTTTSKA